MKYQPLDIGIVKGCLGNPMDWIIYQRTSTFWGHCFIIKNENGDLFNPRTKGIENNHISKYDGREMVIRRYKYDFDKDKLMNWCLEIQRKSTHYDFIALIGFLTGIKVFNDKNSYFCSEFLYWCWQDNGYKLTDEDISFPYPCFFTQSHDFSSIS